jgi:hypothetical protein
VAIVIVNEVEGVNQDFYDKVNGKVMSDGRLPEGCQAHIAGPVEKGWRIISVWNSEEQFHQFRDQTLIPALREVAGDDAPVAPKISTNPVYRFIAA